MEATAKTEVRLNLDPREYILLLSMTAPYEDAAQLRRILAKSRRVALTGPEARHLMDWTQNRHPEWSDEAAALVEKLWHTLSKLELKFEPVPESTVLSQLSTLRTMSVIGKEAAREFRTLFAATLRNALLREAKGVGNSGCESSLMLNRNAPALSTIVVSQIEYYADDACDMESFVLVSPSGQKITADLADFSEDDCLALVHSLERNGMLGDGE